LGALPMR